MSKRSETSKQVPDAQLVSDSELTKLDGLDGVVKRQYYRKRSKRELSNNISLTASMRSNLLSLQNISRQVSSTQNKLATGNKVNSAIDNPSSYYTARSLNNRANDLDALLDSMGQAVSTIKAATTALETGATFLEQAAAVATSALETNTIPAKSFFEEKVGDNGAVVSTAQELKDAIAAGKETIVVYGKIDYFENENLQLQNNQKLVGTEYYTGYTGKEKFSALNFVNTNSTAKSAIIAADNTLISDLAIKYDNASKSGNWGAIDASTALTELYNLDINVDALATPNNVRGGIYIGAGMTEIGGHINVEVTGESISGILVTINNYDIDSVNLEILSGARVNINVNSNSGYGIYGCENSNTTVNSQAVLNIKNAAKTRAIHLYKNSVLNVRGQINSDTGIGSLNNSNNKINIYSSGGLAIYGEAKVFVFGDAYIQKGALLIDGENQKSYTVVMSANKAMSVYKENITSVLAVTEQDAVIEESWWIWPEKATDKSQYGNILEQYDSIIKDSTYKGVNLLKDEKLNVRFNENGSADLNVNGKDMSSNSLGLSTVEWSNQGDIAQSLQEIASALKSIRAFTAELGNNYSIITNRQEFTENLINILTEGADKLTLADMNEESANMLSLQTRQQLAINSLSLASQASQTVLKLF